MVTVPFNLGLGLFNLPPCQLHSGVLPSWPLEKFEFVTSVFNVFIHLCISSKFARSKVAYANHVLPDAANPPARAISHSRGKPFTLIPKEHRWLTGISTRGNYRTQKLLMHPPLCQGAPRINKLTWSLGGIGKPH